MITITHFKKLTIYIMSLLYIIIGLKHFIDPSFFLKIIPPFLPLKKELVLISGFFEIAFGVLLLFHKTRFYASWGIILLLIAVFPANIYLYLSETPQEVLGFTKSQALVRMPFQIPLLIIAYWHSMESSSKGFSIFCCILFIPTIIYFGSI